MSNQNQAMDSPLLGFIAIIIVVCALGSGILKAFEQINIFDDYVFPVLKFFATTALIIAGIAAAIIILKWLTDQIYAYVSVRKIVLKENYYKLHDDLQNTERELKHERSESSYYFREYEAAVEKIKSLTEQLKKLQSPAGNVIADAIQQITKEEN